MRPDITTGGMRERIFLRVERSAALQSEAVSDGAR
jgi:hypothetical protein